MVESALGRRYASQKVLQALVGCDPDVEHIAVGSVLTLIHPAQKASSKVVHIEAALLAIGVPQRESLATVIAPSSLWNRVNRPVWKDPLLSGESDWI
jgi:hypothetical protein